MDNQKTCLAESEGARETLPARTFRAPLCKQRSFSFFIFTLSIVSRGDWVSSTNYALRDYLPPSSQGQRRDRNPGKEAGWFELLEGSWIHVDCGVIFTLFHNSILIGPHDLCLVYVLIRVSDRACVVTPIVSFYNLKRCLERVCWIVLSSE